MQDLSDGELMELIASGDTPAFQILYSRYSRLVFGYSMRLLKNRQAAEDIAQDVWIKVVRLAASYRGDGSVKSWLLTVTRNASLSHMRTKDNSSAMESYESESADIETANVSETEETLMRNFEVAKLVSLMNELPDAQRIALVLWISEHLSYEEIAKELSTTESAVKSLIFRARRSLEERSQ